MLKVSTVSKFQIRICTASQEKENKILYILASKEMGVATVDWEQLQLTLDNSKSEEIQCNY